MGVLSTVEKESSSSSYVVVAADAAATGSLGEENTLLSRNRVRLSLGCEVLALINSLRSASALCCNISSSNNFEGCVHVLNPLTLL